MKAFDFMNGLVGQIPGMGGLIISEDDDQKELMWHMFRVKFRESPRYPIGYYIWWYEDGTDFEPFEQWTIKICNADGDIIYLYKIEK